MGGAGGELYSIFLVQYGHEPCARVWELRGHHGNSCCALSAHSFGIQCVVSSLSRAPARSSTSCQNNPILLSLGFLHGSEVSGYRWLPPRQTDHSVELEGVCISHVFFFHLAECRFFVQTGSQLLYGKFGQPVRQHPAL